jgi:prolyl oligopeptidase
VDLSGQRLGTLPLPSHGTASFFPCRPDTDTIFYRFTSFTHPPSILIHRIHTPESQIWASSKISFDPSSIEIERVVYPSKDGTRIPMFLVCRKDRRLAGPLPTFLTGYGGFGSSITPKFTAHATCLIERGCLFAVANIRGGAEFGEAWHLAAQRHNRQTAVDDFIAAAEWLLAEGYAERGRMAIGGASNAGLLVGAALTQRPGLFRAAICLGPLLDMLRYHLFDFADKWTGEYGSPQIEKDFHALLRYSPYHAVRRGVPYPAVMLISGGADTRCNPMHARKMVARLQAATCSEHPILLDYRPAWGHVPTQPLSVRTEALTDRLAFLHHELGLAP